MTPRRPRLFALALCLASIGGIAALASGCGGPTSTSVCEKVCACQKCTQVQQDQCVTDADSAQKDLTAAGCSTEYDDYLSCADQHLACKGTTPDASSCISQALAIFSCAAKSTVQSSCSKASAHVATCLKVTGSSSPSLCLGPSVCQAALTNAASCEVLVDASSGTPTTVSADYRAKMTACGG